MNDRHGNGLHNEVDATWAGEIGRRAQEIADGTVDPVDWKVAGADRQKRFAAINLTDGLDPTEAGQMANLYFWEHISGCGGALEGHDPPTPVDHHAGVCARCLTRVSHRLP